MSKQLTSLQDRLAAWADEVREQAATMAPGQNKTRCSRKSHRPTKPQNYTIGSIRRSFNRRNDHGIVVSSCRPPSGSGIGNGACD